MTNQKTSTGKTAGNSSTGKGGDKDQQTAKTRHGQPEQQQAAGGGAVQGPGKNKTGGNK